MQDNIHPNLPKENKRNTISKDNVHRELFLISEGLFKLKPWDMVGNEDIFGLYIKGQNQLYFVCIMGSGGIEYGLLLMQGWKGYLALADASSCDIDHDTLTNASHLLSVSLCRKDELPPGFTSYYKRYDPYFNYSRKYFYWISAKEPGKVFRPPKDDEAQILYLYIKAIIELTAKGQLQPQTFKKTNKIRIFDIILENNDIQIISRYENIMIPKPLLKTVNIDEETLKQLKSLPRLPTIYNMAAPSGMVAIKDIIPRIFFIHDEKTDIILIMQAIYEENLIEDAFNLLKDVFLGKNFLKLKGLPKEIRMDSRLLYDSFKEILASLEIRVVCVEHIPKVREIINGMQQFNPRDNRH